MEIRPRNESKKGNVLGSSSTFIIIRRPPFLTVALSLVRKKLANKKKFYEFSSFSFSWWQHTKYTHLKIRIFQPSPLSFSQRKGEGNEEKFLFCR